jgi:formate dehydrogenase gamma subunit
LNRFDVHQRLQHIALAVSFIVLVLSGLPLKFPDAGISQWWVAFWGGVEVTRSAHRFGAYVMVLVAVYHAVWLLWGLVVLKRPFPVKMIPSRKDIVDFYQDLAYSFGLRKEKAVYDRYNWREKFDYWAIFWGVPVMAGSGFVLMYPVFVTEVLGLPGWVVPAALVAHSDEAMLALTWIFVVHMFFAHLAPGAFPMNTSIFTGKVSKEKYKHEHPLEYERLTGERVEDRAGESDVRG